MKNQSRLSGILMLIFGIILLIWPGSTLLAFCQLIGWCLIIVGAVEIISSITGNTDVTNAAGGAVALIVGIVFIARPYSVMSILPFLIGLIITIAGVVLLIKVIVRREQGMGAILSIIGGVIVVVVGILFMFNPFSTIKLLMIVLGIILIYFGILRIGTSM